MAPFDLAVRSLSGDMSPETPIKELITELLAMVEKGDQEFYAAKLIAPTLTADSMTAYGPTLLCQTLSYTLSTEHTLHMP